MRLPKIQPTRLDRLIAYIAPVAGARRLAARQYLALTGGSGGYTGARRDRRQTKEWLVKTGSPDADLLPDLPALRDRSRDLYRNAPLPRGAINTNVTSIVGTGLTVQARVNREFLGLSDERADQWESDAERIFGLWSHSRDSDIRRTLCFAEQQDVVLRSALLGGDVFAFKRFIERPGNPLGFCWQLVEGDRVSNPDFQADGKELPNGGRLTGGVETDPDGAPIAYHVANRHPGDIIMGQAGLEWRRVPVFAASGRRMVLHIGRFDRPEQTRGEPYLAPVIETLKQLDQYREAEILGAVVAAMFTVFVKAEGGQGLNVPAPPGQGRSEAERDEYKLGPGAILDLDPDESIEIANPNRPNSQFDPFVLAILRQIGVALEIPFELLVKHFTASYSAARAALLEAWRFFRVRRAWLAAAFCQPTYEEVISEAIARGYLTAPGFFDDPFVRAAWLGAEWTGPAPGQIDPEKEVNAAEKRIAIGVSSIAHETAELTGRNWEAVHAQRVKEKRRRVDDGLEPAAPAEQPGAAATPPRDRPDQPERGDREEADQE